MHNCMWQNRFKTKSQLQSPSSVPLPHHAASLPASMSQIEVMRHSPGGPTQEHQVKLFRRRTRLIVAILFGKSDWVIRDLARITPENWGAEEAPGDGDVQLNWFLPEGLALHLPLPRAVPSGPLLTPSQSKQLCLRKCPNHPDHLKLL